MASLTLGRAGKMAMVAGPLGWGLALFLAVLVSGPISGGHVNPAVSVSLAAIGKFPLAKVAHYVVAQYLGAFMGAVLVYWIYIDVTWDGADGIEQFDGGVRAVLPEPSATAHIFATFPQAHVGTGAAFLDQLMGTALLLVAIRTAQSTGSPLQAASVIGASLTAIGLGLSHNCMGALNPARDLAPRVFSSMAGWGASVFSIRGYNWFWVPVLGPHLGGLLGVLIFHFFATAAPAKADNQESPPTSISLDEDKPGRYLLSLHHIEGLRLKAYKEDLDLSTEQSMYLSYVAPILFFYYFSIKVLLSRKETFALSRR
ncbi:AQP3 [Cordylochernes scorpioides]|uniref:AQP3 n=1 Tax=Cordylochernes scorpioides TaxID=51811 RepID=A0ABY6JZY9_9ARAC|nr:AQP3 [Cordylochernes scorpioides]